LPVGKEADGVGVGVADRQILAALEEEVAAAQAIRGDRDRGQEPLWSGRC